MSYNHKTLRTMEKLLSYEELRVMAINAGIPDSKVAIGLWAKDRYYIRKQIRIDGQRVYRYFNKNEALSPKW